ncbi:sulfatase-like hydrolase/transferase [Tissierella sp. MB52-C2]|uniref:LTA synthase family protein n=1 Tax=Tissierella sp. MB52-C2 TaxID=3070999 RepID=UPI00280A4F2C|nr:sulfatase-like hydrolase/transferase [Tissierella sp. MB52-C2]WMM24343.1 sulfatase-like hydrolase/transferase [Tissierella sp. MB52-C2]
MKNKTLQTIIAIFLMIILSLSIMTVTLLFSRAVADVNLLNTYFKDKLLILMNFIPIFLFMVFAYLIFNRLWASFSLTSLLFITLSIINKLKLSYRDDPFTFIDLKLFGESLTMAKKYEVGLSKEIIMMILLFIGISIALKFLFNYKIDSSKIRVVLLTIFIIGTTIISKEFYFSPEIYERVGDKSNINIWIKTQQFQVRGFVYPFLYSSLDAVEKKPEGYNKAEAVAAFNSMDPTDIREEEKVNIIAIMLESYNDFSKFPGAELNIDIYKNLHDIQKESIHGNLVTNIFAGDTIKTERGFLTGFHNQPKYYKQTNSFVWYLKEQGYRTEAMHPITGQFYNRQNANEYLGFDYFEHMDNRYKDISPDYLRDEDFFKYIIEGYEKNKGKSPYFNFSVTYQNHGPYPEEPNTDKEYLKRKDKYDEKLYNIINNYFVGINKTDEALKDLVDYFRKEEEPTIIILFGDHNPWLGKENSGYTMMDINLDLSTVEGFKNYYETPYLIWGNNSAKEVLQKDFQGRGNDISPNFLMAELFQYLGWEGNEYMQELVNLKENIDVVHQLFFKENGEYKKELSEENKDLWEDFKNKEYYHSQDFKK